MLEGRYWENLLASAVVCVERAISSIKTSAALDVVSNPRGEVRCIGEDRPPALRGSILRIAIELEMLQLEAFVRR